MTKYALSLGLGLLAHAGLLAQNVGIGTNTPNPSAKLEIQDANRGLLIPRMALTNVTIAAPVTAPATGLLVYNTNNTTAGGSGTGFYYWNGTRWVKFAQSGEAWLLNGNAGTDPAANFVGTTDGTALSFRTDNQNRVRIFPGGQTVVNAPAPFAADVFSSYAGGTNFAVNSYAENGMAYYGEVDGTGTLADLRHLGAAGRGIQLVLGNAAHNDLGISVFNDGLNRCMNLQQSNVANATPVFFAQTASPTGRVVNAQITSATSTTQAGYFSQASTGTAVAAFQTAAAVWGQSEGIRGGVFLAAAPTNDTRALSGIISSAGNFDAVGVYAEALTNPGWGIGTLSQGNWRSFVGIGDVQVIGGMTVTGAKPFTIDHPADPENKYLRHFSIESNEVLNVYRGNAVLDANGEAVVQLPDYFHLINTDFSYQLTPIGAAANLYIKEEIDAQNGTFRVAGGQAGMKVSWTVQAQRNDPYLQQNPDKRRDVYNKDAKEVGKYLTPELYNQPESRGMFYEQTRRQGTNVQNTESAPAPATINKVRATEREEN